MHNSDHFITEKNFKISSVEKMRTMNDKSKFKDAKLKKNEIEDELVNQQIITLKGLHALCLIHDVSITYIYENNKYCEFLYSNVESNKCGVVIKNNTKSSVKYDVNETYMTTIRNLFWKIENIQKPLGAPSYYSVGDLQDICKRLEIPTINAVTGKNKLKTALYEDILKTM